MAWNFPCSCTAYFQAFSVNAFSVTYPLRTAGRRNVSAAHNNEAQGLGKRGTTYQCVDMMIIVTNYRNQYMHCNTQSGKLNHVVQIGVFCQCDCRFSVVHKSERATPKHSLCNGVFTNQFIFSILLEYLSRARESVEALSRI